MNTQTVNQIDALSRAFEQTEDVYEFRTGDGDVYVKVAPVPHSEPHQKWRVVIGVPVSEGENIEPTPYDGQAREFAESITSVLSWCKHVRQPHAPTFLELNEVHDRYHNVYRAYYEGKVSEMTTRQKNQSI